METVLSIIILVASLIVVYTVAVTESDQAGLGTLSGDETSMWGEHRGTSKKEMQNKIIRTTSIIFAVALVILAAL